MANTGKITYQDAGGLELEKLNTQAKKYVDNMKSIIEISAKFASGNLDTSINGASDSLKKATENAKKLSEEEKELIANMDAYRKSVKSAETSRAKLNVAQTKATKETIKNRTELAKSTRETKLNQKATDSAEGSYNKISAQLSLNIEKWKSLSKEQRTNTKAGRDLGKSIKSQRDELKDLDKQTGTSTRNVGNYWGKLSGLVGTLGITTGIAGAIKLFKSLGESVLSNSQTIADQFDIIKAKGTATFDAISRAIANADFNGLADEIYKARAAAGDYTKEQDDLADTMRSLSVETAEVENEVYRLRGIYSVTGGDAVEKLEAVRKANKLLLDLQQRRSDVTEDAINSELSLIQKTYDLTEEQKSLVTSYIKDYGKASSQYQSYEKANYSALKERERLQAIVNEGTSVSDYGIVKMTSSAKEAEQAIAQLNESQLNGYDAIAKAVDGLSDAQRTRITDALADQQNQERATQRLINETNRQTATIEKQSEAVEETNDIILEKTEEATESATIYNNELLKSITTLELWESQFNQSVDNIILKQNELTAVQRQAQIDEQDRQKKTREAYEMSKDAAIASAYQVFQFGQVLGDRRVADIEAQVEAGTKTEEQGAKEISEIRKKQARAEKAQAIIDIAINTAVAISKVMSQTGIFGLAAWIPIAALGAIQSATVLAQPIPAYEDGGVTKTRKFIAGEAGEELMVTPKGETFLSNSVATLYKGMPVGTTIIPNDITKAILSDSKAQTVIALQSNTAENSNTLFEALMGQIGGLRKDFRRQKTITSGISDKGFYLAEQSAQKRINRVKAFQE